MYKFVMSIFLMLVIIYLFLLFILIVVISWCINCLILYLLCNIVCEFNVILVKEFVGY